MDQLKKLQERLANSSKFTSDRLYEKLKRAWPLEQRCAICDKTYSFTIIRKRSGLPDVDGELCVHLSTKLSQLTERLNREVKRELEAYLKG